MGTIWSNNGLLKGSHHPGYHANDRVFIWDPCQASMSCQHAKRGTQLDGQRAFGVCQWPFRGIDAYLIVWALLAKFWIRRISPCAIPDPYKLKLITDGTDPPTSIRCPPADSYRVTTVEVRVCVCAGGLDPVIDVYGLCCPRYFAMNAAIQSITQQNSWSHMKNRVGNDRMGLRYQMLLDKVALPLLYSLKTGSGPRPSKLQ